MAVADAPTIEDEIRAAMREYCRRTGIPHFRYARMLGIQQSTLSEFIGGHPIRGLTLTVARAAYRLHPELRPSLHAAVFGADAVAHSDGEQVPA